MNLGMLVANGCGTELPEKVLVDQLDPPSVSAELPSVSGTVGRVVLVQSSPRKSYCIFGILGF